MSTEPSTAPPPSTRKRPKSRSIAGERLDRLISWVAAIACFLFVSSLWDTRLTPLVPLSPSVPFSVEVPETARDGSLSVAVLAKDGAAPVTGARVRVFWGDGGRWLRAGFGKSDEAGSVVLPPVPRGVLWVLVDAPGYARASTQLVLRTEPRSISILLAPAHRLQVSVEDDQGHPLKDATVLVTSADPLPFGELTGAQGLALFDRLGPGPWNVKASARGYESVTRSGAKGDVTLTLRRLGALEVSVEMPDGTPAVGAEVVLSGSSLWPARRTSTDAQGRVRVGGLLAGAYDVRATRGSLVSVTAIGLELGRGDHLAVTLRLEPGRMVTALVTDGDAENAVVVPGADVVLVEGGLSSFPLQGRTGPDGTVRLGPIPTGPATLSARAEGFVARAAIPVPDPLEGPVQIPLLRGGTLKGEVVDSQGRVVDGASIEIIGTDLDGLPVSETPQLLSFRRTHFQWALPGPALLIPAGELGVMPGPIPPIPDAWPALTTPTGTDLPTVIPYSPWVTRLDGTFSAHPVTPGRVRALVRHPDFVEAVSEPVTLGPGGVQEVRVVLLTGGAVEGKLVDESGYAVSGARIDLMALEGTLERSTNTATDGTFAFSAIPTDVQLSIYRPGDIERVVFEERLQVPEGETLELELELPAARESVTVRVVDPQSAPVEVAQVTFLSLAAGSPLRRTLFTDAAGEVKLDDVRGLSLQVVVRVPGYARLTRRLGAAPERVELTLEQAVIVSGRVTAVRGRTYVSGARIQLVVAGERRTALTDDDGGFRIKDVSPGPARLIVDHPDYARAERAIRVTRTTRDDRPFELPEIDLSPPATVEGTVVDDEGEPVVGARVAVDVAPAFLPVGTLPPGVAVSDVRGHFVLRGIAAGVVRLEAYAASVGRGAVEGLEVDEQRPTTGVVIKLTEPAGASEPASSGSVAVTLGERDDEEGRVDVVVVHVAPGSEAERAGLRQGDLILEVDGLEVADMDTARLELSGPVRSDVVILILSEDEDEERKIRVRREKVRR